MNDIQRELDAAYRMIVLLMEQREWGAATGALLEDPVVKRAKAHVEAMPICDGGTVIDVSPIDPEDEEIEAPEEDALDEIEDDPNDDDEDLPTGFGRGRW